MFAKKMMYEKNFDFIMKRNRVLFILTNKFSFNYILI